ncbi:MAG: hypothetical protein ACK5LC_06205 [Coprobacillaceae bacterium]
MGLFEIFINIVESMLLTYFIFKYQKFKYDKEYILITGIILIEEMISSYIDNQNRVIIFAIPITLFLYQLIRLKKFSINDLLMSIIPMLFLAFSGVVTLFTFQLLRLSPADHLYMAMIISKIICFMFMYYFSINIDISKNEVPQLWQFNLVVILLITIMDIDLQGIMDNRDTGTYVYIRIVVIAILVLLLYRFLRQFIDNANQRIYYELELQKAEYEKKNANIVLHNKIELDKLEHNLKYVLLSITLHAQHNDIEAIKEQANNYLGRITMANHSIATKNPYFDYVFNEMSHEFKFHGISLKKNITLSEDSTINDSLVADKIVMATKKILELAITNKIDTVDIRINEDGDLCFIYYVIPYKDYKTINSYVNRYFNEDYFITFDKEFDILKISLSIDIE